LRRNYYSFRKPYFNVFIDGNVLSLVVKVTQQYYRFYSMVDKILKLTTPYHILTFLGLETINGVFEFYVVETTKRQRQFLFYIGTK
jgi:hypothetical protein